MSKWINEVTRARARVVAPRPTRIAPHVFSLAERECHDGIIRYDWSCSCGNALGTTDTEEEARGASKVHEPTIEFTTRPAFPFRILKGASK